MAAITTNAYSAQDIIIALFSDWSCGSGFKTLDVAVFHWMNDERTMATHVMHGAISQFFDDNACMIDLIGVEEDEEVFQLVRKLIKNHVVKACKNN